MVRIQSSEIMEGKLSALENINPAKLVMTVCCFTPEHCCYFGLQMTSCKKNKIQYRHLKFTSLAARMPLGITLRHPWLLLSQFGLVITQFERDKCENAWASGKVADQKFGWNGDIFGEPLHMLRMLCPSGLQQHDSQLHLQCPQPLVSLFTAQKWLAAVT